MLMMMNRLLYQITCLEKPYFDKVTHSLDGDTNPHGAHEAMTTNSQVIASALSHSRDLQYL